MESSNVGLPRKGKSSKAQQRAMLLGTLQLVLGDSKAAYIN